MDTNKCYRYHTLQNWSTCRDSLRIDRCKFERRNSPLCRNPASSCNCSYLHSIPCPSKSLQNCCSIRSNSQATVRIDYHRSHHHTSTHRWSSNSRCRCIRWGPYLECHSIANPTHYILCLPTDSSTNKCRIEHRLHCYRWERCHRIRKCRVWSMLDSQSQNSSTLYHNR